MKTLAVLLVTCATPALAQDTRQVSEPHIPAACTVLKAGLIATKNALAEADEIRLDTERIQKAMDSCGAGKAVELRGDGAHNAFLSGPLELRSGVTLLVDKGVTLYASRNPKDFDTVPGTCGTSGPDSRPCKPLIGVHDVTDAAVMGEGAIDGRGDRGVLGKTYTWWQQSRAAVSQIPAGDVASQGLKYSAPRLIVANHADGLVLYRIRLHNSPNFHVTVSNTNGFTAWGVHLLTPTVRGTDARNTDGIDPGTSQNVTVTKSWIDNGDDNIAIKNDVQHMSVIDNHFFSGHGMSIGSEARGEDSILVGYAHAGSHHQRHTPEEQRAAWRRGAQYHVSQCLHEGRARACVHHAVLHGTNGRWHRGCRNEGRSHAGLQRYYAGERTECYSPAWCRSRG